jgi:hypothetical protein
MLAVQVATRSSQQLEAADRRQHAALDAICHNKKPSARKARRPLTRKARPLPSDHATLVEVDAKLKCEAIERIARASSVAAGCRAEGIARDTFYRWKREYERAGLEGLRCTSRRKPLEANRLPPGKRRLLREIDEANPHMPIAEIARRAGVSENGARAVLSREVWIPNARAAALRSQQVLEAVHSAIRSRFPPDTRMGTIRRTLRAERLLGISRPVR